MYGDGGALLAGYLQNHYGLIIPKKDWNSVVCSHCCYPPSKSLSLQIHSRIWPVRKLIQPLPFRFLQQSNCVPQRRGHRGTVNGAGCHAQDNISFVTEICWDSVLWIPKGIQEHKSHSGKELGSDCLWRSRPVSWPKEPIMNTFCQMWHFTGTTVAGTSFSAYTIFRMVLSPRYHCVLHP